MSAADHPDAPASRAAAAASVYRRLGVEPIINCGGSRTFYGNSVQSAEVRAAVDAAAREYVLMPELIEAVGRRLAALLGVGWGTVTTGSAGGLGLAAAACVASGDPAQVLRLPRLDAPAPVVLMPAGQRLIYDQAIRLTGCRIIEVASRQEALDLLDRHRVVMFAVFGEKDAATPFGFADLQPLARQSGIPLLVDAASETLAAPEPWTRRGADLVVYSLGKAIAGPPATGLLLGREDLVRAASVSGAPQQGFGRAMKLGKEQIVGAAVAVEAWLGRDTAAQQRGWLDVLEAVAVPLRTIPGVSATLLEGSGTGPRLRVAWPPDAGLPFPALRARLLGGRPRILVDDYGGNDCATVISPFGLERAQAAIVGAALAQALRHGETVAHTPVAEPASVSGVWRLTIAFAPRPAVHELHLRQLGTQVAGSHGLPDSQVAAEITGSINGRQIEFQATHRVEANHVRYAFRATLRDDGRLEGVVTCGAASSHTQGPVGFAQYGSRPWHAVRAPSGGTD